MQLKPITPFNWQNQPATIQLGRVKSKRQIVIDATRVNPEQYSCTPNLTNSKKAPR